MILNRVLATCADDAKDPPVLLCDAARRPPHEFSFETFDLANAFADRVPPYILDEVVDLGSNGAIGALPLYIIATRVVPTYRIIDRHCEEAKLTKQSRVHTQEFWIAPLRSQ